MRVWAALSSKLQTPNSRKNSDFKHQIARQSLNLGAWFFSGFWGLVLGVSALASAAGLPAPLSCHADWRWVRGAVFVPTSAVNEAQQWDEYDPAINDRELYYASV